jgi:hypothetical protein
LRFEQTQTGIDQLRLHQEASQLRFEQMQTGIDQLRLRQQVSQDQIDTLTTTVDTLTQEVASAIGILAQESDADRTAIREMQADIRGLQTENRRILDILENRLNGNGNQSSK